MRRITKAEKNVFSVLVLLIPAILTGAFSRKLNGDLFIYAVTAVIGAVVWRVWLLVKDSRSRRRAREKVV